MVLVISPSVHHRQPWTGMVQGQWIARHLLSLSCMSKTYQEGFGKSYAYRIRKPHEMSTWKHAMEAVACEAQQGVAARGAQKALWRKSTAGALLQHQGWTATVGEVEHAAQHLGHSKVTHELSHAQ